VPGNIDIVENTKAGLVARSGDIEHMSKQLVTFMDVETRNEYAKKARAGAKIYDWSAIAKQYIQVYEEALNAIKYGVYIRLMQNTDREFLMRGWLE